LLDGLGIVEPNKACHQHRQVERPMTASTLVNIRLIGDVGTMSP